MEQINYQEEIRAAIDNQDEGTFKRILLIDNIIEYLFKTVTFFMPSLSEGTHEITKKREEALIYAAKSGWKWAIMELAKVGINVNHQDEDGCTAFRWAIQNHHFDCAEFLVKNGADINHTDKDGLSALITAAQDGHYQCLLFLIKNGADVNLCSKVGMSALYSAVRNGHFKCMKLLLKNGATVNYHNSGLSARSGDYKFANMRNRSRANKCLPAARRTSIVPQNNHVDCAGNPIEGGPSVKFHRFCGTALLFIATKSNSVDILRFLIKSGADVNAMDEYGQTALYTAAHHGYAKCVELLAKNGADINCLDKYGFIPLHAAARNGHFACVRILVEYGANHKITATGGKNAIEYAHEDNIRDYLQHLDENESEWMFACRTRNASEMKRMLSEDSSVNANEIGIGGNTGLHFVAKANNTELYNLFVGRGVDQNTENEKRETPQSLLKAIL